MTPHVWDEHWDELYYASVQAAANRLAQAMASCTDKPFIWKIYGHLSHDMITLTEFVLAATGWFPNPEVVASATQLHGFLQRSVANAARDDVVTIWPASPIWMCLHRLVDGVKAFEPLPMTRYALD